MRPKHRRLSTPVLPFEAVDIGLPGLDGYEVGRRLREALGDRIRSVALTGYSQPEDRRRVREAGFDVHLVKPVVPPDILGAITTMETNKWEDDGHAYPRPPRSAWAL